MQHYITTYNEKKQWQEIMKVAEHSSPPAFISSGNCDIAPIQKNWWASDGIQKSVLII